MYQHGTSTPVCIMLTSPWPSPELWLFNSIISSSYWSQELIKWFTDKRTSTLWWLWVRTAYQHPKHYQRDTFEFYLTGSNPYMHRKFKNLKLMSCETFLTTSTDLRARFRWIGSMGGAKIYIIPDCLILWIVIRRKPRKFEEKLF